MNNTEEISEKLLSIKLDFTLVEGTFDRNKFMFKKFKADELILAVLPEREFAKRMEVSIDEILSGKSVVKI